MYNNDIANTRLNDVLAEITQWHYDRNLIDGSTSIKQFNKLCEELKELQVSLLDGLSPIDDIGDMIVVLVNIAERNGLTIEDCVLHAYNEIKDRTGRLNSTTGLWEKD